VELNDLSSEAAELRNIFIASCMASCYLILDRMLAQNGVPLEYEEFRHQWIDLYKEVYRSVSKMKPRGNPR
jgi:hypothetical protein